MEKIQMDYQNLLDNPAWSSLMQWVDETTTKKIAEALKLTKGEERDAELDKLAAYAELKKLIVNRVKNSI